jgi:hypothetical protein
MATVDTLPPTIQRFSLATFYYSTGSEGWLDQLGFLNSTSHECSDWFRSDNSTGVLEVKGLLCNNISTVVAIDVRKWDNVAVQVINAGLAHKQFQSQL